MKLTINLKDYNLTERAREYIEQIIKDDEDFNETRFENWLKERNVAFKDNPTAYVIKCFKPVYEKGCFSRIEYIPATQTLFNEFRSQGIVINYGEDMYIDIMLTHLRKKEIVNDKELIEMCDKAIKYIKEKNEKPNTKHFIDVFKNSKKLKGKVDWEEVNDKTTRAMKQWEEIMEELYIYGK